MLAVTAHPFLGVQPCGYPGCTAGWCWVQPSGLLFLLLNLCGGGTSRVLKTGTGGRAGTGAACRALVSQFLAAGQAFAEVKPKTEGHSSCGVG